jgi:hypothetical protein
MPEQLTRRARRPAGIAVAIAAVALAAPPWTAGARPIDEPAPAAKGPTGPCPGTLIYSIPLKFQRKRVAELAVYYHRRSGRNCARMNHTKRTWGKRLPTAVFLNICRQRKPGTGCDFIDTAIDDGRFKYYAGPVSPKTSGRGRCIFAKGAMQPPGSPVMLEVSTSPVGNHCRR